MLLFLAAQVSPIEQTPYWACLQENLARLERSGEPAADVATAALAACVRSEPSFKPSLMRKVRAKVAQKLIARVVEIRAR